MVCITLEVCRRHDLADLLLMTLQLPPSMTIYSFVQPLDPCPWDKQRHVGTAAEVAALLVAYSGAGVVYDLSAPWVHHRC